MTPSSPLLAALALAAACTAPLAIAEVSGSKPDDPKPESVADPELAPRDLLFFEIGWSTPHAGYVADHPDRFRARDFDGIAITPTGDGFHRGANEFPIVFDDRRWTEANVGMSDMERLDLDAAGIPFSMIPLQADVIDAEVPDPAGYFDDARWETIDHNLRLLSRAAAAAGMVGFFFDTEPYVSDPFTYASERYPGKSREQVKQKVRERYRTFIEALQSELPGMRLVMIFGLGADVIVGDPDSLMPALYDGMLDGIAPGTQIVDGNENGYYNVAPETLHRFRRAQFEAHTLLDEEHRALYVERRRRAHGFYTDLFTDSDYFAGEPFFNTMLPCFVEPEDRPAFTEASLYNHARQADDFVWTWTETHDWWRPEGERTTRAKDDVPQMMLDALASVKRHVREGTRPEPIHRILAEAQARRQAHLREKEDREAREARAAGGA
ncbi:hypothetical protein [Phycisphaera mikurensis]|uniref:Uncharacterized protein n=1 Tax=Phycisphaera mikurensis (strain NBRC 102666 / KCTC 22515 / FYK2301M01) TaxID=1142394 RepID=I0ICP4_PHYMF|nr:hypothetical protein [Phycisphaera mikurensis]MBB6442095.1 hypothetical protein [Phycisphaera mikurensis]BAM03032.1 hypothetical protein PSMK_08730 [Phycisphaera mikurensis NBRC 102666]